MAALDTWVELNSAVMSADEKTCHELLKQEKAGKKRQQFMLRIHSRINKIRAERERGELIEVANG